MNDIFISYSRKDKDRVETLALALEAEGYDVWWDPEILPGQDYEKVIKDALNQTHCVLTVWSENSIQSHWVRAETSQGLVRHVYVPVLYQQVEVPMQFGHIQSSNLIDWQGKTNDPRYQKLLRAIALKVKSSQKPNPNPIPKPRYALWVIIVAVSMGGGYFAYNAYEKQIFEIAAKFLAEKKEQELSAKQARAEQIKKEKAARLAEVEKQKELAREREAKLAEERKQKELAEVEAAKQKLLGQFIDNEDGTITDTKTKLMWKKCSEGLSDEQCEQGKDKEYTWDEAMALAKKTQFATYSDWRLPTKGELRSLVYCSNGIAQSEVWSYDCDGNGDKGEKYQRPTINQIVFPKTKSSWYWSSSPYAYSVSSAWIVNFSNGHDDAGYKDSYYHVRLVRSGQ